MGPFRAVTAGLYHVCAIRTDNRLSCWGDSYAMPTPPRMPRSTEFAPATEGVDYLQEFAVTSSSAVKLTVEGNLPAGVTLRDSTTGSDAYELSGTPSKPGVYKFTLVASNLFGTSRGAVALRVIPAPGTFDVNGDGRADLPVGVPGENVDSTVDAGQVLVMLGAADGTFGREGAVAISQETVGQRSERGDRFGATVTTGEVTGDNYVDLIIGMPGENKGAGEVIVVHGSAKGLVGAKRTVLRQGLAGAAGAAESGDGFGAAISVGDGLWVGAPGEDLGSATNAGVVTRFMIAPLRTTGSIQYRQGSRKVPGKPEKGDRFGAALAGGGALIGAPGEDIGRIVDAGAVTGDLKYGLTQNSDGVPGKVEAGDQFGASLARSGKLWSSTEDGDWYPFYEIAIGAPGEDIGSIKDAGMIIWGSDEIFNYDEESGGVQDELQSYFPPGRDEPGDRFGAAVTLSIDNDRIVVGAPGEDVGTAKDAGAISVLSLCDDCPGGADIYATFDQNSAGVPGSVRAGSQFGATLSERPGTTGGYVVGAPREPVSGRVGAGAVIVMPPKGIPAQELHQDSPGVPGGAETGDRFGTIPGP